MLIFKTCIQTTPMTFNYLKSNKKLPLLQLKRDQESEQSGLSCQIAHKMPVEICKISQEMGNLILNSKLELLVEEMPQKQHAKMPD